MPSTDNPPAGEACLASRSSSEVDGHPLLAKPGHLLKEVKFFSICTNDSILYTLVVDRTCENVAGLDCTALSVVLR